MKTIQTPLIITSFSAKVDGSLRLSGITPELSNDEKVAFMDLQNMNTIATFKPVDFESDIKEVKGEFDTKTPSQRLRNTIWRYWEAQGQKGDFDTFYKRNMENLINKVKSLI